MTFCVLSHKELKSVFHRYGGGVPIYHKDTLQGFPLMTAEYFDGKDFKTKTFSYDMVKILKGHYNEN